MATSSRLLFRCLFTSRVAYKDFISKVPGMGDSITEGSLIKLVAAPGTLVKQDQIVAVIETDKVRRPASSPLPTASPTYTSLPPLPPFCPLQVSVDVRSPHAGVLKAFHAALNDTVAVGAPLFTLDTDAAAAAGASAAAPSGAAAPAASAAAPRTPPPPPPPSAASIPQAPAEQGRKPSIHFRYGVRAAPLQPQPPTATSSAAVAGDFAAVLDALYPSKKGALPELTVSPSFGRPALSSNEEFLIFSGGAYGAPPPPLPPAKGKGK